MKYVKEEISKLFKQNYIAYLKSTEDFENGDIKKEALQTQKKILSPRLREIIYVSKKIMTAEEISICILPCKELWEFEKELCKPLN